MATRGDHHIPIVTGFEFGWFNFAKLVERFSGFASTYWGLSMFGQQKRTRSFCSVFFSIFVNQKWKVDNGTFRPGYLVELEKGMQDKLPRPIFTLG
ncbi:hypothetical protein COLO4_16649 [Corchorus olitorius]|uniref:Uncharacterized protein n=1 Tax=Corchorus olitorius TaxID=93759 RepID=A0A1R3JG71_9ROSI|nr:hypothetical protein COLO4_16649 [Corchorus olitorius]